MGIVARHWLPSAAVVPQERGADFLGPVDDAEWSEGLGYYRGFFSSFRVKAGKAVWFHWPLPTPVEQDGRPLLLDAVSLLWETREGARIGWIVAQHGGMERRPLTERLAEPPSIAVPHEVSDTERPYHPEGLRRLTEISLNPRLQLRFGVQLCVMISAEPERDGLVRFYGAGAAFADSA